MMFDFKKFFAGKKTAPTQDWKSNALVQKCLSTFRGSCTVAGMDHREAVEAVVSIANAEDRWECADAIPEGWLTEFVFIHWSDNSLPVMRTESQEVLEHLDLVTAVTSEIWLVNESLDRIVHIGDLGKIRTYSV